MAILASFHTRSTDDIPERIDSMELAWLVHQVEQKYGVGHGGSWGALTKRNWRATVIDPNDARGFDQNRVTLRLNEEVASVEEYIADGLLTDGEAVTRVLEFARRVI